MFKQFRDGWKLAQINKAMNAASAALAANRIDIVEEWLKQAHNRLLDTTLPQTALNEMLLGWRLMAHSLQERGHNKLAEQCTKTANLLQARFEVGDFYREY